jgi:hypothetical protein
VAERGGDPVRKPKFQVDQVVMVKFDPPEPRKIVKIRKNQRGFAYECIPDFAERQDKPLKEIPWTESEMRPLTAREIGPRGKGGGK